MIIIAKLTLIYKCSYWSHFQNTLDTLKIPEAEYINVQFPSSKLVTIIAPQQYWDHNVPHLEDRRLLPVLRALLFLCGFSFFFSMFLFSLLENFFK